MSKAVLVLCLVYILQRTSGQCIGSYDGIGYAAPLGYGGPVAGPYTGFAGAPCPGPLALDWAGISAASGGGLAVASASPIAPVGVSVLSDNAIEGSVAVGGALPYLGAVALEAALPTAGGGSVAYGCGNGAVAITAEDVAAIGFAGVAGPFGHVPGITGPIGAGLAGPLSLGPGYGCGAIL